MNRKQRRKLKKQAGAAASEALAGAVSQFGKLPQQCSACDKQFDKQNKEMVQSWSVVVKQEIVRLFCPDCIKKTQEILNERRETFQNSP